MKLIIVNGPCGVGKSTLSARLHADMPLSFYLDIDAQRRSISHYREYSEESAQLGALIANSILKTCFDAHRDVLIDKMTFDEAILDSYYKIAADYGANVYEIILWAPRDVVMSRAENRGWKEGGLLTPEKCERFWYAIDELKNKRPAAHIINTENEAEDELYIRVRTIIER